MPADISDKFTHVALGTLTQLATPGYTIGDTSINGVDLSAWPTDTAVYFGIDTVDALGKRVNGSYTEWKGIVSANTVGSLQHMAGPPQDYTAGTTTRLYQLVTAAWGDSLIDGLLVSHNHDGTLKANAVTSGVIAAGAVATAAVVDAAITKAKLERPHYNALFLSTGGATGGIVASTQVQAAFDAADSNGVGITAATGSAAHMVIARDGVYHIDFYSNISDGATSTEIVWLDISTDSGVTYSRYRQQDRTIAINQGQAYSWTMWLTAGTWVALDWYSSNGVRHAAQSNSLADRMMGPKLSITEVR